MDQDIDRKIGERLARRDIAGALCAMEQGYGPEIRAYLRSKIWHEADAEDAYGNFRLAVVRGIADFEGRSSLRSWAYVIARRIVLEARRRGRRGQQTGLRSDLPAPSSAGPSCSTTDPATRAQRLYEWLSEEERELLLLRVRQELSFAEIAEVLSSGDGDPLSVDACKQRFARLKRKLSALYQAGALAGATAQRAAPSRVSTVTGL